MWPASRLIAVEQTECEVSIVLDDCASLGADITNFVFTSMAALSQHLLRVDNTAERDRPCRCANPAGVASLGIPVFDASVIINQSFAESHPSNTSGLEC